MTLLSDFSERISRGHKAAKEVRTRFYGEVVGGCYFDEEQYVDGFEVKCSYGRVDVLLTNWVVEIKELQQWKSGIGQLMVYGLCWPERGKWLHVYASHLPKRTWSLMDDIEEVCETLGVRVTFDQGDLGSYRDDFSQLKIDPT